MVSARVITPLMLLVSFSLAGCSQSNSEDRAFIVDTCAPVYEVDWTNFELDSYDDLAAEYSTLKNKASNYGDEAKEVSAEVAELVAELDAAGDKFQNETRAGLADFDLDTTDLDELKRENDLRTEEFWAERDRISGALNEICAPYFE